MKKLFNTKTKKGITSFYVVIFATLILSVVVVSFVRVIISETGQTSNDDLSQSAYDAALAGVEDAKTALLLCLTENDNDVNKCSNIANKNSTTTFDLFSDACNVAAKYLGRIEPNSTSEVPIQTTSTNKNTEDQAYTCVTINNILSDYRATLSSANRTSVVDLSQTDNNQTPTKIRINWYSRSVNEDSLSSDASFSADSPTPPPIVAQIIQANGDFTAADLGSDLEDGTGQGTVVLYPSNPSSGVSEITAPQLTASGTETTSNQPYLVNCSNANLTSTGFACSVTIELPSKATNLLYAHLSLPYATEDTDFSIELLADTNGDGADDNISIKNAQFSVDSTGRTNDLYRRVETRIELGNQYFPIPEYVAQVIGSDSSGFNKNFYTTTNCWTADNGTVSQCSNYGNAS